MQTPDLSPHRTDSTTDKCPPAAGGAPAARDHHPRPHRRASARNYTRYLAEDGPEGEGQWLGRQADGLGLDGLVSTDDLEALLSGHSSVAATRLGTPLVDRYDAKGRLIPAGAGFDATFSAPKSLSIWWGLTGDPGLLEAHDLAVRAALQHLERFGSTNPGGVSMAPGSTLMATA